MHGEANSDQWGFRTCHKLNLTFQIPILHGQAKEIKIQDERLSRRNKVPKATDTVN